MVILDMGMFPLSLESKLEKLIMRFEKTADLTYNPLGIGIGPVGNQTLKSTFLSIGPLKLLNTTNPRS